jgi:threonine-phosphate decarboxylase
MHDTEKMKMAHGGDIYRNNIRLDFSVNINPLGMPKKVRRALGESLVSAEYYPDQMAEELTEKLSKLIKINSENIAFGNGASELFMAAVHASAPKKILIPVPSFYGYEHAAKAADADIEFYHTRPEDGFSMTEDFLNHIAKDTDMVFIANPNNPTGKYINPELLEKILLKCEVNGVEVILDECFMELSDEPETHSCLSNENGMCSKNQIDKIFKSGIRDNIRKTDSGLDTDGFKNLLVLRSFTKTFAIPGLRLGYMVCADENKIREIKRQLPEWNVSSLAQIAGCAALEEAERLAEARRLIKTEREFLEKELTQMGFQCVSSKANYILFKERSEKADIISEAVRTGKDEYETQRNGDINLYEELLKAQILIRDCSDYRGLSKGWYRIAVRSHEDNLELLGAIKALKIKLDKTNNT